MNVRTVEEPISRLDEHSRISIAFVVDRILSVSIVGDGLGGIVLCEEPVASPWLKDYDAARGEGPTRWPKRFDTSRWGLLAAYDGETRVGGAVVALDTPGVTMLEPGIGTAVLWDLRVRPEARAGGVGSALFAAVESWIRARHCRTLIVETQNINVPACRFYARMGCRLGAINCRAYPELPDEAQLLWFKNLGT